MASFKNNWFPLHSLDVTWAILVSGVNTSSSPFTNPWAKNMLPWQRFSFSCSLSSPLGPYTISADGKLVRFIAHGFPNYPISDLQTGWNLNIILVAQDGICTVVFTKLPFCITLRFHYISNLYFLLICI